MRNSFLAMLQQHAIEKQTVDWYYILMITDNRFLSSLGVLPLTEMRILDKKLRIYSYSLIPGNTGEGKEKRILGGSLESLLLFFIAL
jgi:hypothetical protein